MTSNSQRFARELAFQFFKLVVFPAIRIDAFMPPRGWISGHTAIGKRWAQSVGTFAEAASSLAPSSIDRRAYRRHPRLGRHMAEVLFLSPQPTARGLWDSLRALPVWKNRSQLYRLRSRVANLQCGERGPEVNSRVVGQPPARLRSQWTES